MPTKSKPKLIYWDSCVFIAAIQREANRFPVLKSIIADATAGRIIIVASVVARAEVAKLNQSTEPLQDRVRTIADFFENPFIELRDTTERL
jgi:hypothetical protein